MRHKFSLVLKHLNARRRWAGERAALAASREAAPDCVHIAVFLSGGIGDQLVIARFMRDLHEDAKGLIFHVFAARPANVAWTFRNVPGFSGAHYDSLFPHVMGDYDIALRASSFVFAYAKHVKWARICRNPALADRIYALIRNRDGFDEFVAPHPYRDHELVTKLMAVGQRRRDYLHALAELPYGGDRLDVPTEGSVLARFGLSPKTYITVHNGFDQDFVITGTRATKCYPHFGAVITRLRAARPDLTFVQVGTVTSEAIPECDVSAMQQTSLAEAAALVQGAVLHLDNEGGLVHVAACLGTKSVVVFGPTPADYFGYPDNINIEPPVSGGCWWSTRSWMDTCPEGFGEPRCVTEQDAVNVATHVLRELTSHDLYQVA